MWKRLQVYSATASITKLSQLYISILSSLCATDGIGGLMHGSQADRCLSGVCEGEDISWELIHIPSSKEMDCTWIGRESMGRTYGSK